MRKILFISYFLSISAMTFAQSGILDVYMKDGSIITGTIKSQDGNIAIIKLLSGSEIQLSANQVKKTMPMNSVPADSIYRVTDFSKFGFVTSNADKTFITGVSDTSQNDQDFIKLKSGKIIYGDVTEDPAFLSSSLLVDNNQKFRLNEITEYRLNKDEYFVREPGLFGGFLKREINGRIQVFETTHTQFSQGAPIMTGPGQWSSGPSTISSKTVKYFRIDNHSPLQEYDADYLIPILKSDKKCSDLIKKYEEGHKTSIILKIVSGGFIGAGLIYFLSADNKKDAIGVTAGLSIVGSVISFIPGSESKYLDQAVDIYNKTN